MPKQPSLRRSAARGPGAVADAVPAGSASHRAGAGNCRAGGAWTPWRRPLAALLALTFAAPAWPQGTPRTTTAPATPVAATPAARPPQPVPAISGEASDQVYDNLNRSVKAGQKSEFGLRTNNAVVEAGGVQLPDLGDPSTASLSPDMEKRLGDRIMRDIRRDPLYVPDPLLSDYLNALGYGLVQAARRQSISGSTGAGTFATGFDLFAVRDRSINAFALPGGYIGVHTGLLVQSDTESELASVLGHEIGHVMQRHIARGITSQDQSMWIALASMVLAGLAATRSPDAAAALAMGGQGAAIANQLSFSRGAEREADRVGFQILTAAGFDPQGMPDFFMRLQRTSGTAENSVPSYVRTHPLTSERIADMQDRVSHASKRKVANTPEYEFARMRARVIQESSPSDLQNLRAALRTQLPGATALRAPALHYGLAFTEQRLGRYPAAEQELAEARRLYGNIPGATSGSPMLDVMAVELARAQGRVPEALSQASASMKAFPLSHAVAIAYADTLVGSGRYEEAVRFLRERTRQETSRSEWWELLARAYAGQGKRLQQHQALAEKYAMDGAYQAAIEQLQIARKAGDGDFYTLSEVDARLHQLERQYREDKQDSKGMPN
ncbi:peptidase M48 [Cupriavidus sp. SK-4]|uniref:beta-barrel assembly-enhancing protease n=1 Tax=Cupriavidus sp. SK-4 TaxID=574750 RepID=UPI0004455A6E|nr:M48 family metalloprotease [Cupriavidus sp. SK-4]EYS97485.1 peptidase M48 [Cupriavidus sp. SK-4]